MQRIKGDNMGKVNYYYLPLFRAELHSRSMIDEWGFNGFFDLSGNYYIMYVYDYNRKAYFFFLLIPVIESLNLHFIFKLVKSASFMVESRSEVLKLHSFFGYRVKMKKEQEIDFTFDRPMLLIMENMFFHNTIRKASMKKFGKDIFSVPKSEFSNIHWKSIKSMKSDIEKGRIVSDADKFKVFSIFSISIDDYFDKLNQYMMGQLMSMYQFKKAYLKDSLLGTFLDVVASDFPNKIQTREELELERHQNIMDFLGKASAKWKEKRGLDGNN